MIALGSGLLLGWAIFLNYGLGLMALPAVAVLVSAETLRTALRAVIPAVLGALVVVAVFQLAGFWWFDGYSWCRSATGRASHDRPFQYWSWANLASTVCAVGLGGVAGIGRASTSRR